MADLLTRTVRDRIEAYGGTGLARDLYHEDGAEFYERLVGPDRSEVREVLRFARASEGEILDIAAGGGRLTVPLLRLGRTVAALDLSEDMLARLQTVAGGATGLTVHIGDMADFTLGRSFGLIVLGATSISLLDAAARRGLYSSVRRHLAKGGRFVFSVADARAASGFRLSEDRVIEVALPQGPEDYLVSQQVTASGGERVVNFVRMRDLDHQVAVVGVFASRLQILDATQLREELIRAGFREPSIHQVRSAGGAAETGTVLLEATLGERA